MGGMKRFNVHTSSKANQPTYDRLKALAVGESLTVTRAQWKGRTTLANVLRNSKTYQGQFAVRSLGGGTGWVIRRLKDAVTRDGE
jgi:hypothetical protein